MAFHAPYSPFTVQRSPKHRHVPLPRTAAPGMLISVPLLSLVRLLLNLEAAKARDSAHLAVEMSAAAAMMRDFGGNVNMECVYMVFIYTYIFHTC